MRLAPSAVPILRGAGYDVTIPRSNLQDPDQQLSRRLRDDVPRPAMPLAQQ